MIFLILTPVPPPGIWFTILDYMASIAIVTNAFVIAFTSDYISQVQTSHTLELKIQFRKKTISKFNQFKLYLPSDTVVL